MAWPSNVTKADLTITYYRGSGPGGQNKNKRDTCCRMKHIPTGIMVTAEEGRTQGNNRGYAFRRLVALLVPIMKSLLSPTSEKPTNTSLVRTYREKDGIVRDKRLGACRFNYDRVLDGGDLDIILQELLLAPSESDAIEHPALADLSA